MVTIFLNVSNNLIAMTRAGRTLCNLAKWIYLENQYPTHCIIC